MTVQGILKTPGLLWRAWMLIIHGLDGHLEKTLAIMEGYHRYLKERGMTPDEDARSAYYVRPVQTVREQ